MSLRRQKLTGQKLSYMKRGRSKKKRKKRQETDVTEMGQVEASSEYQATTSVRSNLLTG